MAKQVKGLWAVTALVMGLGMGFTAGASAPSAVPIPPSPVECSRDVQCDGRCGAEGAGQCVKGRCYCLF